MDLPLRKTFFGSLTPVLKFKEELIAEFGVFEKEGKSHTHEKWEICYVQSGEGDIIIDGEPHEVRAGSIIKIPPNTGHWMIPKTTMHILIVYSENS